MSLYVPRPFGAANRVAIARLVHDHPFATLVTPAAPEPHVSHVPLIWVGDCEPYGTLLGHFARANPHVEVAAGVESIAIFHGPHAYVSPSWYADPAAAVPTWNYAVVHAHGTPRAIEDKDWLYALVTALTDSQESHRAEPWKVTDAPDEFVRATLGAIVGIEMPVTRLVGKWKSSQNRSEADRAGVSAQLPDPTDLVRPPRA